MKHLILKSLQKLKLSYKSFNSLAKSISIEHPHRVIAVDRDELGDYIATVQVVGKNQIFKIKPEEILSDDAMTCSFSQKDIRMLTYLGYLSLNYPKYKILAQKPSEIDNNTYFAVHQKGDKNPIVKTAQEISVDTDFLKNLNQLDAHMVGYTVATENILRENAAKSECKELSSELT